MSRGAGIVIWWLLGVGFSIFLWWLSDVAYGAHWILGAPIRIGAVLSTLGVGLMAIGLLALFVQSVFKAFRNE